VISENIDDKNIRTFESNLAMLSGKIQQRDKEVALTRATDHLLVVKIKLSVWHFILISMNQLSSKYN
jgi:hypothetical protein